MQYNNELVYSEAENEDLLLGRALALDVLRALLALLPLLDPAPHELKEANRHERHAAPPAEREGRKRARASV